MRTGPGGGGSSTSDFEYVSKSRIDPSKRLLTRQGGDHRPELGPALPPGERAADGPQVAADGLQLAHDRLGGVLVEAVRAQAQLAEPLERRPVRLRKFVRPLVGADFHGSESRSLP